MGHRPNAMVVAVAWVKGVDGIEPTRVATTRPRDRNNWYEGFVQVGPVVGGSPDMHVKQRESVLEISCWAMNLNSAKPPWGRANDLAEIIINQTYLPTGGGREVTALLPSGFDGARVQCTYPTNEPREFDGDEASAALYKFELAIQWTPLT